MNVIPRSIQKAIEELSKLPGIGPKTAGRLVFFLIKQPVIQSEILGTTITELRQNLKFCQECFNVSDKDRCDICSDQSRDQSVLCIVEQSLDTVALEKARFEGRYHILGGAISPIDGIDPEQLTIQQLIERIENSRDLKEIIIATNPTLEGEATALYIKEELKNKLPQNKLKVSRIAHGLPIGGDLEYADAVTLTHALSGRREMK